jgi:hypothetical protein
MKNIELEGADFLLKQMKAFGPTVEKKATKTGVTKGARRMLKNIRNAAPNNTGRLRRQLGIKVGRKGIAWIGLRKGKGESKFLGYYKTLDFDSKRGKALNPWFEKAAEASSSEVADIIIKETTIALYAEATKVYKRSMRNNGRNKSAFGSR